MVLDLVLKQRAPGEECRLLRTFLLLRKGEERRTEAAPGVENRAEESVPAAGSLQTWRTASGPEAAGLLHPFVELVEEVLLSENAELLPEEVEEVLVGRLHSL